MALDARHYVGPTYLAPGAHKPFSKYLSNETKSQKVVPQRMLFSSNIYLWSLLYCIGILIQSIIGLIFIDFHDCL